MLLLKVVGMLLKYELNELAITSGSLIMMPWYGACGFQEKSQCFPVGMICSLFFVSKYLFFLPSVGWLCGVGVFGLIECSHSLSALHSGLQMIMIIIDKPILVLYIICSTLINKKTYTHTSMFHESSDSRTGGIFGGMTEIYQSGMI